MRVTQLTAGRKFGGDSAAIERKGIARRVIAGTAAVLAVAAAVAATGAGALPPAIDGDSAAIERHKAIARRWSEDLWGRGNLAVADEIIASTYVRHDPGDPFPARGPEEVKRIVTMLRAMLSSSGSSGR